LASFRRHIEIAALGSGMLSTAYLGSSLVNPVEAIVLWVAGTFGGILPDVDSDNSTSLKIVFNLISLFLIAISFFFMHTRYTTVVIWGSSLLIYCVVNLIVRPIFESLTVHRGIFHSVIAGLFFSVILVDISYYYGKQTASFSWMIGLFLLFGFLIHLALDEISSVDISNNRIKRSFGTAFKLFEYKNVVLSTSMLLLVLIGYKLSPSHQEFYQEVVNQDAYLVIANGFYQMIHFFY
jgi:ABC-type transport system involved in multi-copper enzyme maturation permease subunit